MTVGVVASRYALPDWLTENLIIQLNLCQRGCVRLKLKSLVLSNTQLSACATRANIVNF